MWQIDREVIDMAENNCFANYCDCEFWENDYCWAYGKPVCEVKNCPKRNKAIEGGVVEVD